MYLPGYYSMKDLSNSAGYGGWSLHHESKSLKNGQHYDLFLPRPIMNEFDFDGYNKERLRQTIMEHESIFRHQVHELHRLYKIQRDLMNEIKSKERVKKSLPAGTSKSSPFSYGFASEDEKRSCDISKLPSVSSNNGSSTDFIQSHYNSMIKGKIIQSSSATIQNGVRLKDYESLDSKSNKHQRRFIDLELPADEYINDGNELQGESEMSRAAGYLFTKCNGVTHARDENISNCASDDSGYNHHPLRSGLNSRRTHKLTDLNEPIEIEEVSASTSVNSLGNETCSKEEIQRRSVSTNAYTGLWSSEKELFGKPHIGNDGGGSSLHVMNNRNQKEWSSYTFDTGQIRSKRSSVNGSFHLEDYQKQWESSKVEARKASDLAMTFPSDQNTTEKQMKRTIFGVEISERHNDLSPKASSRHVLQTIFGPQSHAANSDSSSISCWTKPPISLNQSLMSVRGETDLCTSTHFSKGSISLVQSPQVIRDRLLITSDSGSTPSLKAEVSYQDDGRIGTWSKPNELQASPSISFGFSNGIADHGSASDQFAHGPRGHYWGLGGMVDAKSTKGMNDGVPSNKCLSEVTYKQNVVSVDERRNQDSPQGGFSWLRAMPLCNGKSCKEESKGSQKMKIDSSHIYSQQFVNQTDTRRGPSQCLIQDSPSTTHGHDTEHKRVETSGCSGIKKILGFPIIDSPTKRGCFSSVIDNGNHVKTGSVKSDLACDRVSPRSEGEQLKVEGVFVVKGLVNDRTDLRNQIDLNKCITEEEGQLTPTSPVVKTTTGIDLEATVDSEIGISHGIDSLDRCKGPQDLAVCDSMLLGERPERVAAEALVAISSSHTCDLQDNAAHDLQENHTCHQSEASQSDSLHWFADIISSFKDDNENEMQTGKGSACDEESIPDGIDYFEYMTLNLTETEVDDICHEHQNLDNPKEEEPLPRRPRRGQARRGRQRKDFQRDILPGIASLSRNEVTEDLQTIEGIIRATGGTWQSSLATRNAGKGGGGRGRRRTGCSAPSTLVAAVCQQQIQQSNCREVGGEDRSLTGWGKRTRRPPRQRCSLNNSPVSLK
ncbi:hypothetical protein FNV43_RR14508 [Rhamnella rubrinervis]|uniref:Uncharacterized protein n=1 Tax=Rhamnella rubrinervis TaxID=2594499 RepID=A0A8K0MGF0_9ROSA|nr:hypothetical protein FNV43_RR14508 [Rhamnella rubrinervis]